MTLRYKYQNPIILSSRLTYQPWSLLVLKSMPLQRFAPSTTVRGNLFDGFVFGLNIDQTPDVCFIRKERLYEIAAPKSSISGNSLAQWSYKLWAWFFSQAEQFTTLRLAFGKNKTGYFRSRFRKYVFYHETAWLRRTFKYISSNLFMNYGITVRQVKHKNLFEFFLRFNLFPVKFRPAKENLLTQKPFLTRNNRELFKRFRWSKLYSNYFTWTLYTSKILRANYSRESLVEASRLWLLKYKFEREAKKKQKKRSRKKRLNTRFRRRRFGKKRSWLKFRNWRRTFAAKFLYRHSLESHLISNRTKRFSFFMYSFWKTFYLNPNQTVFAFNLYRRFIRYYKNKYKLALFYNSFDFYASKHLSYFLLKN